jgi:uncharacterized damage-inducible protein DinB
VSTITDFVDEYGRQKAIAEKAFAQVSDEAMHRVLGPDNNSIAMLVRHVGGNLASRFTAFLTSDGEKPWRDRDSEFEETSDDREAIERMWAAGWRVLEESLAKLTGDDLEREITIRGVPHSVHQALCRSLAHVAYHTGQIVLLARMVKESEWQWISIPKGKSAEYNLKPTKEKSPG